MLAIMHCPNCGKDAAGDQQFCRFCGMNLETIGKLVAQHSSSSIQAQKKIDKVAIEQAAVRRMLNWLTLGIIILGIGVAMMVINKSFDIGKWLTVLSSFLMLSGTGVATAGVLNAIRGASGISPMQNQKSLGAASVQAERLPSITEGTTQLFPAEGTLTNKLIETKSHIDHRDQPTDLTP